MAWLVGSISGLGAAFRAGRAGVVNFSLVRGEAFSEVVNGFRSGRLLAVKSKSSLCPPDRLLPVLGLLTDRHLSIGLENRYLAELGEQGIPDTVHFGVVS